MIFAFRSPSLHRLVAKQLLGSEAALPFKEEPAFYMVLETHGSSEEHDQEKVRPWCRWESV